MAPWTLAHFPLTAATRRLVAASSLCFASCAMPEYGGFIEAPPPQDTDVEAADAGPNPEDSDVADVSEPSDGAPDDSMLDSAPDDTGRLDAPNDRFADARGASDVAVDRAITDGPSNDSIADVRDGGIVDARNDSAPDASPLPFLNAWHYPTKFNEPPTVHMRNPVFPAATARRVTLYVGAFPKQTVSSGSLTWWWTGPEAVTPVTIPLIFDTPSASQRNEYWTAFFDIPEHAVGTFHYYFTLVPKNPSEAQTTYIYGADGDGTIPNTSMKTASQTIATAGAFKPKTRLPTLGELVISEIMMDSFQPNADTEGEWFELTSRATVPVALQTCQITDSETSNGHSVDSPDLIIWPGAWAVLGATMSSANMDGFLPDYAYGTRVALDNTTDILRLSLPGDSTAPANLIDQVSWSGLAATNGRSLQVKKTKVTAIDNDSVMPGSGNWCVSSNGYGPAGRSFGTPKAAPDCP